MCYYVPNYVLLCTKLCVIMYQIMWCYVPKYYYSYMFCIVMLIGMTVWRKEIWKVHKGNVNREMMTQKNVTNLTIEDVVHK